MSFDVTSHNMTTVDQTPDSPIRVPGEYKETPHVRRRLLCSRRPITREDVNEAIKKGRVTDNPTDRPGSWWFEHVVDGMRIVVVVGADRYQPTLSKITAFVGIEDAVEAWEADRWSTDDYMVAALLQYLMGDSKVGIHRKRVHVTDPVPYHGHRVIWKDGHTDPYCIECCRVIKSKKHAKRLKCE